MTFFVRLTLSVHSFGPILRYHDLTRSRRSVFESESYVHSKCNYGSCVRKDKTLCKVPLSSLIVEFLDSFQNCRVRPDLPLSLRFYKLVLYGRKTLKRGESSENHPVYCNTSTHDEGQHCVKRYP